MHYIWTIKNHTKGFTITIAKFDTGIYQLYWITNDFGWCRHVTDFSTRKTAIKHAWNCYEVLHRRFK